MVPAHHIFDIYPVIWRYWKANRLTDTIGNAIAIVCQVAALLPAPTVRFSPDFQARTTQVVPLLQVLRATPSREATMESVSPSAPYSYGYSTAYCRRLNGVNLTGSQRLTQLLGMLFGHHGYCVTAYACCRPFYTGIKRLQLADRHARHIRNPPFQLTV